MTKSDSEKFIAKWKIEKIYSDDAYENKLIGFRCTNCGQHSGYLSTINHMRACTVPDYK